MKILVTGALSQIGREIMRQIEGSGHTFVFTDVRESENVLRMDIADQTDIDTYVTPSVDVVINCAAYTDVNGAEDDPENAMKANAYAVGLLAHAARKADALLVHFSTDYIFDGNSHLPYTEDSEPAPLNVYGSSKLAGEREIMASGCRYMIFRISWLYSAHGRNFFKTIAERTARSEEMKVVCDQLGTPTNASDLVRLLLHILDEKMTDRTGVYNYSNEGSCTWYEFAVEISRSMGHSCRIVPCRSDDYPSKAVRPCYSVLDKGKVKDAFTVEIPYWKDSLYMLSEDYKGTAEL